VYGTLVQPLTGAPVVRVTMDDGEPVAFNSSGDVRPTEADVLVWSHVPLFQLGHLPDTDHNISVVVESADEEHPFYFDFFTVSASGGTNDLTRQTGTTVIVNDGDDMVIYTGNWATRDSEEEYLTGSHTPTTVGSTATFRFNGEWNSLLTVS
jgi:hypothetical protein